MPDKWPAQVKFYDGAILSKHYVAIAARLVSLEDEEESSRLFGYADGKWFHRDVDAHVRCICAVEKPIPSIYSISRDGRVFINRKGGIVEEELIKDAGHEPDQFGYLFETRQIGNRVFVCGSSGQIYRREKSGWIHHDQGVLDPVNRGESALYSIDGFSEEDVYTVGLNGDMWHNDGQSWTKLSSPARADLNAVRCVSSQEVYLAGDHGQFFRGHLDSWQPIAMPPKCGDLWGLEYFQDKVFIAARGGLFEYDGIEVRRVETRLKPEPDAHRFDTRDGVMWSFGFKHLCFFDGEKWTSVRHPDNP